MYSDYAGPSPAVSTSSGGDYYDVVRYYVNRVVIPAVLALGAVGNVVVLRRLAADRPPQRPGASSAASQRAAGTAVAHAGAEPWRRRPSERSSLVGLTALSVSDLILGSAADSISDDTRLLVLIYRLNANLASILIYSRLVLCRLLFAVTVYRQTYAKTVLANTR